MARTPLAALVALAVLAGPAVAQTQKVLYKVFLKDGSFVVAREKPVLAGRNYKYQDKLGTWQIVPASEVDMERSEKENTLGVGDAYVLGDPQGPTKVSEPAQVKKPSLSEYIRSTKKAEIGAPAAEAPAEAPAATQARGASAPVGATIDAQVNEAFMRALATAGLGNARLAAAPGGVLRVQAITDTPEAVFAALGGTAKGFKEARAAGRPVEKVELYLAMTTGGAAGKFILTPEDADSLVNGRISAGKFFVANVIF